MGLSLVQEALKELDSTICYCGAEKPKGRSFCRRCYFSLSPQMQRDLYKHISDGYAEIWDSARDFLRIEANIPPRTSRLGG